MRRPVLAALLLAFAFLVGAPGAAAAARVEISDVDVYNVSDQLLTRVPHGVPVRLAAEIRNSGDVAYSGPLPVVFLVRSDAGTYEQNRTQIENLTIAPGKSVPMNLTWTPTETGPHTLEVWFQDQRASLFTLHFVVAKHEVVRSGFAERVLSYVWVFVGFAASLVLFVAVSRVRRSR